MATSEIVFLDRTTLPKYQFNFNFPHHITDYPRSNPEEVASRIAGANIVVTNKIPIDAETIRNSPNLRLIAVPATGLDHIDLQAAQQYGVEVRNVHDTHINLCTHLDRLL